MPSLLDVHALPPTFEADMDSAGLSDLAEVHALTRMIRAHQDAILVVSKRREGRVRALRAAGVTYRAIAEAMGTTEMSVYKIIRGDL